MRPEVLVDVLDRVLTKGLVVADRQRATRGAISVDAGSTVTLGQRPTTEDMPVDGRNEALIAAAEHYLGRLPSDAPHLVR